MGIKSILIWLIERALSKAFESLEAGEKGYGGNTLKEGENERKIRKSFYHALCMRALIVSHFRLSFFRISANLCNIR
jgi:hypothetical protein